MWIASYEFCSCNVIKTSKNHEKMRRRWFRSKGCVLNLRLLKILGFTRHIFGKDK